MTQPVRLPDSEVEVVPRLLGEEVDNLLGCPAERKEAVAHEALSKLRPHLEAALVALETVGRLRGLTDVELARQRAITMLLGVGG